MHSKDLNILSLFIQFPANDSSWTAVPLPSQAPAICNPEKQKTREKLQKQIKMLTCKISVTSTMISFYRKATSDKDRAPSFNNALFFCCRQLKNNKKKAKKLNLFSNHVDPLSTILLWPSPPPNPPPLCANMIRFTGMFKWVILFIHCCCWLPT